MQVVCLYCERESKLTAYLPKVNGGDNNNQISYHRFINFEFPGFPNTSVNVAN